MLPDQRPSHNTLFPRVVLFGVLDCLGGFVLPVSAIALPFSTEAKVQLNSPSPPPDADREK
jgi:hypothetical protein